jgi:hypothetical protein
MTPLTEDEVQRVSLLYELLDANYAALRDCSRIQRMAVLRGCLAATLIVDANLLALSRSTTAAWTQIQLILNPKLEAAPQAPPVPDPPKEVIQ